MCFYRLGEVTLRDFKAAVDRQGSFRYHFKALDPEFGTVKEEVGVGVKLQPLLLFTSASEAKYEMPVIEQDMLIIAVAAQYFKTLQEDSFPSQRIQ